MLGIMKNHSRFCIYKNCKCRTLIFENEELKLIDSNEISETTKDKDGSLMERNKSFKVMICERLNENLKNMKRNANCAKLEIIQAYVNYSMLKRIFNSLYNLMLADDYNLSLFQSFQSFCLRKSIELRMTADEQRNSSSLNVNFWKIINFHKKYMVLHDLIYRTIVLYCSYWYEYLKSKPGIFQL